MSKISNIKQSEFEQITYIALALYIINLVVDEAIITNINVPSYW